VTSDKHSCRDLDNLLSALRMASGRGLLFDNQCTMNVPMDTSNKTVNRVAVRAEFESLVPEGLIYDPGKPAPRNLLVIAPEEKRKILYEAGAFARGQETTKGSALYDVTALVEAGELSLIFVIHRRIDYQLRARWKTLIRQRNLELACGPAATPDRTSGLSSKRVRAILLGAIEYWRRRHMADFADSKDQGR
jgi:hypothetical protein